jgi:hypothetical protein
VKNAILTLSLFIISTNLLATEIFVAYTDYGSNAYNSKSVLEYSKFKDQAGLRTLDILFTCYTENESTHDIDCNSPDSPKWRNISKVIQQAKGAGQQVTLRFYIDLKNHRWRAYWNPKNKKDAFSQMTKELAAVANKAQVLGVDSLYIGSELEELTKEQNLIYWIELIGMVKRVFKGKIQYAANGNLNKQKIPEYKWVPFWSLLDGVSINYYPPFKGSPTKKNLEEHHKKTLARYHDFAKSKKQDLIISEVGFPLAKEGIYKPFEWRFSEKSKPDSKMRALSLKLFLKRSRELKIKEVHFWRFYPDSELKHPLGYLWDDSLVKELKK